MLCEQFLQLGEKCRHFRIVSIPRFLAEFPNAVFDRMDFHYQQTLSATEHGWEYNDHLIYISSVMD